MVTVVHSFKHREINKQCQDVSFILGNKAGSFFHSGNTAKSRYMGFYCDIKGKIFRTIEDIQPIAKEEITHFKNYFYSVERNRKSLREHFFVPHGRNALLYRLSTAGRVNIIVDCKEIYDNRNWGRHYAISREQECTVISFQKKTDSREDDSHDKEEYALYVAIHSDGHHIQKPIGWIEHIYESDKQRNSEPWKRYVVQALTLQGSSFAFAVSEEKQKAIDEAHYCYVNALQLEEEQQRNFEDTIENASLPLKKIKNPELFFGTIAAVNSLYHSIILKHKKARLVAGYPWFFQQWSRDELVSLKGCMLIKQYDVVMNVLKEYYHSIDEKGGLLAHQQNKVACADAPGWLLYRLNDIKKKIALPSFANVKKIEKILAAQIAYRSSQGLAHNGNKETWMDSIGRYGIRIEIQAMRLHMLRFLFNLTKKREYLLQEHAMKAKVRREFLHDGILYDGVNDNTIRPNVFLAYYLFPGLLSVREWKQVLSNALIELFLPWGGLATISKNSPLFNANHTGEDPKSYHNGDSWFYVNNAAAICMLRLDEDMFDKQINAIMNASCHEILWQGAIGHHAEVSSASFLQSAGCLQQTWSSALFLELMCEKFC